MTAYEAVEMMLTPEGFEATGRVETYYVKNIRTAVRACLYTRRLANGKAFIGPTGRVVHAGDGAAWAVRTGKIF